VFAALGDPTRQRLVRLLAAGDSSVSALAAQLPISLPGTMKHLGVLERAGVVTRTKTGRVVTVSLRPGTLAEAEDWLRRARTFWPSQLCSLAGSFADDSPSRHNASDRSAAADNTRGHSAAETPPEPS
jgi:DNA-binding transcriptional ArsR family regulator